MNILCKICNKESQFEKINTYKYSWYYCQLCKNIFSEKKYINIIKWIIYDNPSNTIFGPHLEEMSFYFPEKTSFNYKHIFSIRLFNFIVCLPILFLKNIYNYFNLRLIMYFIIYKIIFSKKYTDLFIRPL